MKVHFAGSSDHCGRHLLKAGIRYRLESFYDIKLRNKIDGIADSNRFRHVIIDSGLFTFMFGADARDDLTLEFCEQWLDSYINFINATPFENADFVEMDVQKKLGPDEAWELRRAMKRRINKGTVINVYHLEDGNPDKLIAFSDYIAISLPELRIHVSEKERRKITAYIARKAALKGKRVHLLGCAEKKYLRLFASCDTCDSTSWTKPFRWGQWKSELFPRCTQNEFRAAQPGETTRDSDYKWAATIALPEYRKYAGNQS